MLHEELAANPEFFVQVISALYKETSADSPGKPSEEAKRVAENGFRLLSSWSIVPGTDSEGELDEDRLRAWIAEARRLLETADRLAVGEVQIGRVLASGGWDAEDRWPSDPSAISSRNYRARRSRKACGSRPITVAAWFRGRSTRAASRR